MVPALVLGPILRHVDDTSATIWVETNAPCTVEVLGASERTWCVAGHHYALVCVEGLAPGESSPYQVHLDGQPLWPEPDSPFPPSRVRTIDPGRPLRLAFGSCRYAAPRSCQGKDQFGADALDAYAERMTRLPESAWPDALLLLGDQVYADETSPATQQVIRRRRDVSRPPYLEVADFEEYTTLYHESWQDPQVRWLLSVVPTSMIFDDHDVHDDWNTSHAWREDLARTSWWRERITGALMSYWVYQHLGNLHPDALGANEVYQKVRSASDAEPILREFAQAADREADGQKGAQWSYRRDYGRVRLLVIDSRCGRILADDARSMVSEAEFRWIESQVEGDYDHLLVGTSLPWLLPRAVHDLESWDEALCRAERPARVRWIGEKLRRGADMEHWAAFRASFDRLARLLERVGRGQHAGAARAPATISVLSGDVHHAYVAEARYPDPVTSRVYQLVCSPLHQGVPRSMRLGFRLGWSRPAELLTRLVGKTGPVPPLPLSWRLISGPFFGNQVATLVMTGRGCHFRLDSPEAPGAEAAGMGRLAELTLS
jgi:PhoD-like phosphatase